ncbi:hypothetical protein [Chondromyces apiculatus]|nr:hypothetical protein [Chondromyces apiculatus]
MGALDTEGWVAELWLAGRKPVHEAFGRFIADGKLTPETDAEFGSLKDGRVEIAPGFAREEEARFSGWHAATLRFSGDYMRAFLEPALRPRFLALSERFADAAQAEFGALYGRCAHLSYREMGAWVHGSAPPAAAAALVHAIGSFAEKPAVNRHALEALGGKTPLDTLCAAGVKLDADALGSLIGAEGGSLTTREGGAISMTFPLGGPIRATRASRIVARKLKVGEGE